MEMVHPVLVELGKVTGVVRNTRGNDLARGMQGPLIPESACTKGALTR